MKTGKYNRNVTVTFINIPTLRPNHNEMGCVISLVAVSAGF